VRDLVRAEAKRLHGPHFLLVLVLTAWGPQAPTSKNKTGQSRHKERW
jgi:hypothetical protein